MAVQNNRSHLNTGEVTWECQWRMSLREQGEKKKDALYICLLDYIDLKLFNMI